MDNLFLEPNLIILIFVISHWLLTWMKAFWRITKTTSSKGKTGLCPRRLSPTHPGRRAGGPSLPRPLKAVTPRSQQSSPALSPGSLCVQSASSSNFVPVGYKRIFCLQICTFSPFFKDGFKPRCLRGKKKKVKLNLFTEESKKYSLGKNAIIFDEMGKGQEVSLSIIVDTIF